jgi:hypothetical protein
MSRYHAELVSYSHRTFGRRQRMLAAAMEAVRDGEVVIWASPGGSIHVTETPMTNAKVRPVAGVNAQFDEMIDMEREA